MAAVADVDLQSILHYSLHARPHHSNLMSGFFNVPCLTKLSIDAGDGTYGLFVFIKKTRMSIHFLIL